MELNKIMLGDCLEGMKTIPNDSVDCCITSPPYYGLRDYGMSGQLGLEKTPESYIAKMLEVFFEVKRITKPSGTLWLNISDSYCGTGTGSGTQESSNLGGGKNTQIEAGKRPPLINQ